MQGYTLVDARIKVARCQKVRLQFAFGTSEKMSVIDKECIQTPLGGFQEDRLPVVDVLGADVNQPCQPEADLVSDPLEHGAWQNLKEPPAAFSQEP